MRRPAGGVVNAEQSHGMGQPEVFGGGLNQRREIAMKPRFESSLIIADE